MHRQRQQAQFLNQPNHNNWKISTNYCDFQNYEEIVRYKNQFNVCGYTHHQYYMHFASLNEAKLFVVLSLDRINFMQRLSGGNFKTTLEAILENWKEINIFENGPDEAIKKNYYLFQDQLEAFQGNLLAEQSRKVISAFSMIYCSFEEDMKPPLSVRKNYFQIIQDRDHNEITLSFFISKIVPNSQKAQQNGSSGPCFHLVFIIIIIWLIVDCYKRFQNQSTQSLLQMMFT